MEDIVGKTVAEVIGSEYEKFEDRIEHVLNGKPLTFKDAVAYAVENNVVIVAAAGKLKDGGTQKLQFNPPETIVTSPSALWM